MKELITFTILSISLFTNPLLITSQSGNVGVGIDFPEEKFHVSGKIKSDSLSGFDIRVVAANADGVIQAIPPGNPNEILVQESQGPVWKSSNSINSTNDCPPFPCPTMFSLTNTNSQLYFGACLRYCGTLTEDNFTDWRVPTIDEVLILAPFIQEEIYGIWTKTVYIDTSDQNYPGSRRMVTYNLTTGAMTIIDPSTPQWCKCVR